MKRFTLAVLLVALCFLGNGIAETEAIRGKIDMNMPDAATPTIEVNLDQSGLSCFLDARPVTPTIEFNLNQSSLSCFFEAHPVIEVNLDLSSFYPFIKFTVNLPEYAECAEMIEGVFIRSYNQESGDLTKMKSHYQEILKTEKWEHIVRVKDKLRVSLLFAETPGVVNGIFVSFTDKQNTTFVNVWGEIDFQKLGILFGKIMESAPEFMKDFKFDGKFGSKK